MSSIRFCARCRDGSASKSGRNRRLGQEYRATLVTVSGLLAACSATVQGGSAPQANPAPQLCNSQAATALIGRAAPDDAQVKQRTGAELIRRIAPGDPVTQDFRENRVTIAIDPAGKIVQANCG